jgi:hypothetical protein
MLPEPGELDAFLQLEAAIRRKILAAGGYGMESEVIEGVETELRTYASRLVEGDETLLDESGDRDPAAGAFAGEHLRTLLMRAFEEGEVARLRSLPWGVGAAFRQGPGVSSTGEPGVFFACRTRDGQRDWRYVESNGSVLSTESEILRRINPGSAPAVASPVPGLDLESAWQAAVPTIVDRHNRRADPRADEERIGPAQRFAVDLLRDPAVLLPPGAAAAEEALTVERSSTVRQALTRIRTDLAEGRISRDNAAVRIVEVVDSFGLQPVEPPPVLDAIEESDVGVVCWMAVLGA